MAEVKSCIFSSSTPKKWEYKDIILSVKFAYVYTILKLLIPEENKLNLTAMDWRVMRSILKINKG